jgi:16S rRNA (adenine1518-N6/adenine1519-N6)-dimethyltransferase
LFINQGRPEPAPRNPTPGTRNPEPDTRHPPSAIRHSPFAIRDQTSDIKHQPSNISHSPMQTLTDIRALLTAHGLRPKHKWGQNFLHDPNHMQRIVDAAEVGEDDLVLEVGAGTGALTERLLEAGARVVAVEIDPDLEPILRQRLDSFGERVSLHIGDVMADKRTLAPRVTELLQTQRPQARAEDAAANETGDDAANQNDGAPHPAPPFKLIANLPYNVASPLLSTLALDHPAMARAVVMVQREVADRLAAAPGGKAYGPLGILVQAMCAVTRLSNLPPSCFWPRPKVGSAVVRLDRRAAPLTDRPQALASLVHQLFTKRRKQLGTILGRDVPLPEGVEPTQRPEQLSVAQLVALAERA